MAALASGCLADGKGIQCWNCQGRCIVEETEFTSEAKIVTKARNCATCNAQGRIYEAPQCEPSAFIDSFDCVRHIFWSRERPMFPTEWMSQPARWIAAWEFLVPYLTEFEERKQNWDKKCQAKP